MNRTKTHVAQNKGSEEIRIGISSCLLGENVRFDGGHKRDDFISETLSRLVTFVPVCPEVEMGMGIPREPICLVAAPGGTRLMGVKSGTDHTKGMMHFAKRRVRDISRLDLSGYIFKKNSPSCGLFRVKLCDQKTVPSRTGRGIFADVFAEKNPHLPLEEEGRLHDPRLRENFFVRVFAYRRLKDFFGGRWRVGDLVRFHTKEKLLLMSHDVKSFGELGRLVADAKALPRKELGQTYQRSFMGTLAKKVTPRRNTNVLQHMVGFLKKLLDPESRAELASVIEDYRSGMIPLVVPVTLIRHHVRVHGVEYLSGQTYLEPHPKELMLRNHV
jgi:uncharacterized protein YbgA (DUF1722 family)/uncharacterized protein YbbK (DUF523 family)